MHLLRGLQCTDCQLEDDYQFLQAVNKDFEGLSRLYDVMNGIVNFFDRVHVVLDRNRSHHWDSFFFFLQNLKVDR